MADGKGADEVDLTEFVRLRDEIDNRTDLSTKLVLAEITALGAGLSVMGRVPELPDVMLGLAAVSTFLWLFWMDHTEQIYKIALYIAQRLAPRLQQSHPGSLAWEKFGRGLGGAKREMRRPGKIVEYISLLFGGASLILESFYVVIVYHRSPMVWCPTDSVSFLRLVALGFTVALFAYA